MNALPTEYYACGKLMLTGEYAVMHGAHAFALPTRFGQYLTASPVSDSDSLHWTARDADGSIWLEAQFFGSEFQTKNNTPETDLLRKLMTTASGLNPNFRPLGWQVETRLEFSRHWGLGSSSTLVALVARWAGCDAFDLFFATLSGSGYDVAVALTGKPVLFKIAKPAPIMQTVAYQLPDSDSLRFIYLGTKQSSRAELHRTASIKPDPALIADIDTISLELVQAKAADDFDYLLARHELLISRLIGLPTVRELLFKDYPLLIKSLGAWGGDFTLARIQSDSDERFFKSKGYSTIFTPKEIIT